MKEIPPINARRLLERFLRYVQVDTTADPASENYPSSPGQWDLGRILVAELTAAGLAEVRQDASALVWGMLPPTPNGTSAPVIAFNAHLDTSPETCGRGVRPQVLENYPGGDIVLPGDPRQIIRTSENPELNDLAGKTLVTTDGTTLLGADDKAGIAVIVEALACLAEHPEIEHGPIRALFTCDEEIGHGVDRVEIAAVDAAVCYTLDGSGADQIDVETFSADLATVTARGINIHPSIAKGRMVNAIKGLVDFLAALPRGELSPETTDNRQGFLHPYQIEGGVAEARVRVLLRDFDDEGLARHAERIRSAARQAEQRWPGLQLDVDIRPQYRNLGRGLAREPRAVGMVERAMARLGRTPKRTIIRGGTDGSRFTELGLPTPNLSTGEHNPHSPLEWTCLEEMVRAAELLVELARVWGEEGRQMAAG